MKVKLFLSLILLCVIPISSCTNGEGEVCSNPLSDTLWSYDDRTLFTEENYTHYIEFVGNSEVKIWDTYTGNVYYGEYTVNANSVLFKNLHNKYWDKEYTKGYFSSKSLTIEYVYSDSSIGGKETYTKE